jgi:hypothetical protein
MTLEEMTNTIVKFLSDENHLMPKRSAIETVINRYGQRKFADFIEYSAHVGMENDTEGIRQTQKMFDIFMADVLDTHNDMIRMEKVVSGDLDIVVDEKGEMQFV